MRFSRGASPPLPQWQKADASLGEVTARKRWVVTINKSAWGAGSTVVSAPVQANLVHWNGLKLFLCTFSLVAFTSEKTEFRLVGCFLREGRTLAGGPTFALTTHHQMMSASATNRGKAWSHRALRRSLLSRSSPWDW